MAELINKNDSLNDGRKKLNEAIKDSNKSKIDAEQALITANESKQQSESTQQQLDQVVIDGDSSVEAAQARVDGQGHAYGTLKQRLDEEHNQVSSQLAQKANENEMKGLLNEKRSKNTFISLNDLDSETISAIEGGEGTSFNLLSIPRDNSVSTKKTTFVKQGKNLFDGEFNRQIGLIGASGDNIYDRSGAYSIILELEKEKTYTVSRSLDTDMGRIGVTVGEPVIGNTVHRMIERNNNWEQKTFTMQGDEDHVIIYLSTNEEQKEPLWVQVEEGVNATDFVGYNQVTIDLSEDSIPTIRPEMTSFAKRGKNKFNGQYLKTAGLNGSFPNYYYSTGISDGVSVVFKGEKGRTYTISKGNSNRFGIALFDKPPIDGQVATRSIRHSTESTFGSETVKLNNSEEYIVIYVSNEGKEPEWLQIEEGDESTPFTKNSIKVNIEDIDPTTIRGATLKNIFDGRYESVGLVGQRPLVFVYRENAKSAIIKIEPNKTYTVSKSNDTNYFAMGTFGNFPNYDDRTDNIVNNTTSTTSTIKTRDGDRYLVIYVSTSEEGKEPAWLQVEEGKIQTDYVEPKTLGVRAENIVLGDTYQRPEKRSTFIVGDTGGMYDTTSSYLNRNDYNTVQDYYDFYDTLMDLYPNYISREVLGNEITGLPIYKYDFKPPVPSENDNDDIENPKILYISGLHGQERYTILDGVRFFTELCEDWKNDGVLSMLRWNVHFVVIPVANPWGVENKSRKNANGVDLNRNFPPNWQYESDVNSLYYGGTEPLSEIESQILDEYLKNNKDILFAIDHHNYDYGSTSVAYFAWYSQPVREFSRGTAVYLNAKLRNEYPILDEANVDLIQSLNHNYRYGRLSQYFEYVGIRGALLETVPTITGISQDGAQNISTNVIGNYILSAIRYRGWL